MTNFSEKLNFSIKASDLENALKINKNRDVNYYETLCFYCSENNINLKNVSEEEFDAAVETIKNFGSKDAVLKWEFDNNFYFSINA